MAKKAKKKTNKRRGYSRRARSEHPGVTIALEKREDGSDVTVLRWIDPGTGKRRKETLKDKYGRPFKSRDRARKFAVVKAKELARENSRIDAGGMPTDTEITWNDLFRLHKEHLEAAGRSPKTIEDYAETWVFVKKWKTRSRYPHMLRAPDLKKFLRHVRSHKNARTGGELATASIEAIARNFKALLNFGRREHACVKLDQEAVRSGLKVAKHKPAPVAISTAHLCDILETAKEKDAEYPESPVFPLLVFFMLTGCRRGEAEGLRWKPTTPKAYKESWCDFDGGRLVIWGNKTRAHRFLPLASRPRLRRLLEAMEKRIDTDAEPYVFGGPLPLAIASKRHVAAENVIGKSLKSPLDRVKKETGIDYALKDFRSTNATYLANSGLGLNLYALAGELGHDYAVLIKHYAGHYALPDNQAKAATLSEVLGIAGIIDKWLTARKRGMKPVLKLSRA